MKNIAVLIMLIALMCIKDVNAQVGTNTKEDRILLVVNGSLSMLQQWNDSMNLYEVEKSFASKLSSEMHIVNDQVGFGLRLYGHQYDANKQVCNDSRREVPFSRDNHAQLYLRLKDITPKGAGSLEYVIGQAIENDITDTELYRYSMVVIIDSNSKCAENICPQLSGLKAKTYVYKLYGVSLTEAPHPILQCFDEFFSINSYPKIPSTVTAIIKDFPQLQKPPNFPTIPSKAAVTPVVEMKRVVEKKETIQQTKAVVPTNKAVQAKPVVIKKNSNITTDTLQYGFLNLINENTLGTAIILRVKSGNSIKVAEVNLGETQKKRTKLPVGEYSIQLNGLKNVTHFRIKRRMITDVRVKQ